MEAPTTARRTPILAALAINALVFFAAGVRSLAVPLYADHLGASAAQVGILFTAFNLPAAFLAVPGGLLADRFGRRASLIAALAAGGVSMVISGLTGNLGLLVAAQMVGGVGAGVTQVVVMASLADSVPRRRLGRTMGWFAVCMQAGLLTGPAVAGGLLGLSGNDYRSVMVLVGGPVFVLAGALSLVVADLPRRLAGESILAPLAGFVRVPRAWALVTALFAATLIWGTNQGYIALMSKHLFGLTAAAVGLLLAVQSVASIAARIPAGRVVDHVENPGRLVVPGVIGFAACQAVLPHLSGFGGPAIVLALSMPFSGLALTALTALFAGTGEAGGRATAMGVFSAVLYLGMATGPAVFAPAMNGGFTLGFTLSATVATLLALTTLPALARGGRGQGAPAPVPSP